MVGTITLPDPRVGESEIGAARLRVEQLVCDLPGGDPADLAFEHPWEIRAFAMTVAAYREIGFDWSDFQQALITSIRAWEETAPAAASAGHEWSYYEHWVAALESVLESDGRLDTSALDAETRDVLAIPANRNHHEAHTEPIAIDPGRVVHV